MSGDIGLNVHGFASLNVADDPLRQQYLQILRNSKVGWARVDVEWRSLQPYDRTSYSWGDLDATMSRAYCAGVNVLGTLDYTPTWASSNPGASHPEHFNPADSTDWINFVSTVVTRYPWVHYWTIWNEPNSSTFYEQSASDYAKLVRWAAPAIHQNADGQQRFVVAGEFAWASNAFAWIDTLLDAQGSNVDILSVHMYGQPFDSIVTQVVNRTSVASRSKEVWLTETGPTGCHDNAPLQTNPMCVNVNGTTSGPTADRDYIDDGVQANWVDSAATIMRRAGSRWTKTFFYDAAAEVNQDAGSEDYGVFGGYTAHTLYGKRALYSLARAAGVSASISMAGPTTLSGGDPGTFTATVTGGHDTPSYYFEWHVVCSARSSPTGDCVGNDEIWDAGWGESTITIEPPVVDGTMTVVVYIRETELDSPVTTAYAAKFGKKISLSRF